MTEKQKRFILHFRESLGIIAYACKQTGVTRQTYYNWVKKSREFKEACDAIGEEALDVAEAKLLSAIRDGNVTAMIFYLKTKGRSRGYVERLKQEVSVNSFEKLMEELPDEDG